MERVSSFKFLGVHITEDLHMVCSHRCSAEEDTSASSSWDGWGSLERAPESSGPSTPALWRAILTGCITAWFGKQHRWQPQGSAKGRANCPPHCWRWASLPPGHLHQAVYKESPEDYQRLQPTRPTVCSLCCPQGDVSAASDPALADWGTAFSLRLSG